MAQILYLVVHLYLRALQKVVVVTLRGVALQKLKDLFVRVQHDDVNLYLSEVEHGHELSQK